MRLITAATLISISALLVGCASDETSVDQTAAKTPDATATTDPAGDAVNDRAAYVLDRSMTRIDGSEESLTNYEGNVILIVNVASRCGLTPQYEDLEALYREYKDRGLVVLGFPANNFMGQEPGTNEQIARFCSTKYDVTFPMFAKISVKGDDMDPLYAQLTTQPDPIGGKVKWNFQKYLVDRDGQVVAMFSPRVNPKDKRVRSEIERLLAAG